MVFLFFLKRKKTKYTEVFLIEEHAYLKHSQPQQGHHQRASVTSEEKSTCPGESIKLIRKPEPSLHCLMEAKSLSESSYYIEIAL